VGNIYLSIDIGLKSLHQSIEHICHKYMYRSYKKKNMHTIMCCSSSATTCRSHRQALEHAYKIDYHAFLGTPCSLYLAEDLR
jgi:hypothetical protein